MADLRLDAALSTLPAPDDGGFSQALEKRLARRRGQRRVLIGVLVVAAAACFAALLFGLSQLVSLAAP